MAEIARDGVKAGYGKDPRYTYAVGTSNGGYQVRRALESVLSAPDFELIWETASAAEALAIARD